MRVGAVRVRVRVGLGCDEVTDEGGEGGYLVRVGSEAEVTSRC